MMKKKVASEASLKELHSESVGVDQRALRTLFQYEKHWRNQWVSGLSNPAPAPDDVEYAKRAGYMFDAFDATHDETVAWLVRSFKKVTKEDATDGFLASLSSRRLEWRSALGSFAVGRTFPIHPHSEAGRPAGSAGGYCRVCEFCGGPTYISSVDPNILNTMRFSWGGGASSGTAPTYPGFDLEQFALIPKPSPVEADFVIMRAILDFIREVPVTARLSELQKGIARCLASNNIEQRTLLETLGFCGILETPEHPGFLHTYTPYDDRCHASARGDWAYPVEFWRGKHGINEHALQFWFGAYRGVY